MNNNNRETGEDVAGPTHPARPVDGLQDQLDRIEKTSTNALTEARKARKESEATNGRLRTVWEDLYGPEEDRRREHDPGLIAKLNETRNLAFDLSTARDESQAVKGARKEIRAIGLTVAGLMITTLGLVVMIWMGT